MPKKKKIVKVKQYIIEHKEHEDGTGTWSRTNDGFTPFELVGLLEHTKRDIYKQIDGITSPPKRVKRKVVVD